jgi:hypothetical protein
MVLLPISPSSEIANYGGWVGGKGRTATKKADRVDEIKTNPPQK